MAKLYQVPVVVKNVSNKLTKLGFAGLSQRDAQLLGQLAKANLYNDSCVQHYMGGYGLTVGAANTVSQWLNLAPSRITLNKSLQQVTAANQPTWLPHGGGVGNNYGYLNGVAGNYFSTPDSAAVSITGDIDLRAYCAAIDWTPSSTQAIIAKFDGTTNNRCYMLQVIATTGVIRLVTNPVGNSGAANVVYDSTVAPSVTNLDPLWIRVTLDVDDGAGNKTAIFYTSLNGTTWTQLGSPVTTAGTTSIFNGSNALEIGSSTQGTLESFAGRIYRTQIYAGLDGTDLRFDFNPATYVSGTTFTDSSVNAATITLNGGATVVTASCLYFDGTNDYLKTGAFTLAQPTTVYFVGKQVTWTNTDHIFDGNTALSGGLLQDITTPRLTAYAGGTIFTTGLAVATQGIVTVGFNGASSLIRINRVAATTGNAGSDSMNGFILGARGNTTDFGNITASEVLVFNTAHNTAQQDIIIGYLNDKYSLGI
jgi:hypothetical protein